MQQTIKSFAQKQHFSFKIKILKVKRKIRNIKEFNSKKYSRVYFKIKVVKLKKKITRKIILICKRFANFVKIIVLIVLVLGKGKPSLAMPQDNMDGSSFLINHYKEKILYIFSPDFETIELIRNKGWISPEPYCKNKENNRLLRKILHRRVPILRIHWIESELTSNYMPKKETISLKRLGPGYKTDDAILFLPKKSLFRSYIDLSKRHLSYVSYFEENSVRETLYVPVRKLRRKMITSDGQELTVRRILKMFMNHFRYGMKKDPLTQLLMGELKRRMRAQSITPEEAFEFIEFFCNKPDQNGPLQKKIEAYLKKTNQQEKTRFLVDYEKPFKK